MTFAVGDATVEPFDDTADGLYSRFGVMFFADPVASFRNIRTALRPDGRTSFTCWRGVDENPWVQVALGGASRYVDLPFGTDPHAPSPFALALADSDRDAAKAMHADSVAGIESWITPDGISAPSASWIVTARNPG